MIRIANPFSGLEAAVTEDAPLAPMTWYKIGGPAKYLVRPRSLEELQESARRCAENDIRVYVLGLGANILVSDQGVDGAVFRLDQEYWRRVKIDGMKLDVGAGADMQ
jgi:UDP-N-acetylmuramate dehydrogenase